MTPSRLITIVIALFITPVCLADNVIVAYVNTHPVSVQKDEAAAEDIQLSRQKAIDHELLVQEFDKKGYSIPEELVDNRITEIVDQQFGGDRSTFKAALRKQGMELKDFRDIQIYTLKFSALKNVAEKSRMKNAENPSYSDYISTLRKSATIKIVTEN